MIYYGYMNVLFVYMGAESLGVEYLAAEARAAGHVVDLAFDPAIFGGHLMWDIPALARRFDLKPRILDRIAAEKPDVAAFSCFTGNYHWALAIAREAKARNPCLKTVFGGVHVTAVPGRVIAEDAVDALAIGEADTSFTTLLDRWSNGSGGPPPPGVWLKENGGVARGENPPMPEDLDSIPFPAKDLFYDRAPALERHYMIMSARGCPYSCTYCYKSLSVMLPPGTKPVRRRSVNNVIEELKPVAKHGIAEMIVFRDDVFTLQKKWLEEFTARYVREVGLPYFCYTHPAALDERSADLIRESGCTFVTMGVQSVDETQRREILNRKYTNDQVRRTTELLKNRGITVSMDHIAGIPGDDEKKLRDAAYFYNELRPERLLSFWLTYYPGTEIIEIAIERGLLEEEHREMFERGEVGYRYSGGGAGEADTAMKKITIFMSLVPLLPRGLVKWLLDRKAYRFLPGKYWFNNLLLFLNAVKCRDPFFFYNLRFFLSMKRVP